MQQIKTIQVMPDLDISVPDANKPINFKAFVSSNGHFVEIQQGCMITKLTTTTAL